MNGFTNSLALRAAVFANQAQIDGHKHLAGGFAALCKQLDTGPDVPLVLNRRPHEWPEVTDACLAMKRFGDAIDTFAKTVQRHY